MKRTHVRTFLLMLVIASCAPPRTAESALRPQSSEEREQLQAACNLTARVCTRCHDFARVTLVKFDRPERWQLLVSRMRYMQSSGITEEEAQQATTCLVYRSFGQAGLDELARRPAPAGPPPRAAAAAPASEPPAAVPAPTPAPEPATAEPKETP